MANSIALALGGGGVKGNAHIGVLRILERDGFDIRAVSGTSAGALWGSFYVAGKSPDEIERLFSQLDPDELYQRDENDGPAWLGLGGIKGLLEEVIGDVCFEELKIPFAVTAVDLDTAERVILNQGSVRQAVLASIAVPGVFPPVRYNSRVLIDGGVLDPVPVSLARSIAPDLPVVAVVLSPAIDEWRGMSQPKLLNSLPFVANYLSRFRFIKALNIFMRSIDIGGTMLSEMRLMIDQPDVIIRPAVPHIGLLDDVDIHAVVKLGEEATFSALPELKKAVGWPASIRRRLRKLQPKSIPRLPRAIDFNQEV